LVSGASFFLVGRFLIRIGINSLLVEFITYYNSLGDCCKPFLKCFFQRFHMRPVNFTIYDAVQI
jgi:hypothetical protein